MSFAIAGREVSPTQRPYVIAEAGVNHDGDLAVAHELVDLAARCGADAVKFQTFDPDALVSEDAGTTPYQQDAGFGGSQRDMLAALTLPRSAWRELQQHCADSGIAFLSSPFDVASAQLLADLGVPAMKVGSGELTNLPYLQAVAALGIPMIISTGMADLAESRAGVQACSPTPTAVLHCVSSYPAPVEQCNLRAVATLREELGVEIGWSDHAPGGTTAVAAIALGATILEKHVTTDRTRTGPDHAASLEEPELAAYVAAAHDAWRALGDGEKRRMPAEEANARLVRRSLHAARDLPAGTVLGPDDVVALRPEGGLPPAIPVAGRRLTRDMRRGEQLTDAHLELRP